MRLFIYGLTLMFLTACGKDEPAPEHGATQPSQKAAMVRFDRLVNGSSLTTYDAERVLNQFSSACPAFSKAVVELGDLQFENGNEVLGPARQRGWTHKYQMTFQVPDRPVTLALAEAGAAGHTCFFQFGGGKNPGFEPGKTACARICGRASPEFVPVREMVWLDDPSSEAYRLRMLPMEKKYQSDITKYKKDAERGDYNAQKNLAYTYASDSFSRSDLVLGCAWRLLIASYSSRDTESIRVDCGPLTDAEKGEAAVQLTSIENVLASRHKK
jgi:hypothetical protein